MKNNLVEN